MVALTELEMECEKCGKKFKDFGTLNRFCIIEKYVYTIFCKKCEKKLKKLVKKFCGEKNKTQQS